MRRRHLPSPPTPEALCRRARRYARRGQARRALLALRQAAHEHEDDPRLWTLYGVQCLRMGRMETARHALMHAAWIRDRRNEQRKADVTRRLLEAPARSSGRRQPGLA
jgi:Flp pilus assembly protein TadD